MKRRRAREYALQMLFQTDFTAAGPDIEGFWKEQDENGKVVDFANALVSGAFEHLLEIDSAIDSAAEHWVLKRMAAVDRNIMRIAVFELFYMDDIPPAVSINEAIEIAKKFSSSEAAAFINGILDKISHRSA